MHTDNRRSSIWTGIIKLLPFLFFTLPSAAFALDPLHPLGSGTSLQTIIGRVIGAALSLLGSLSLVMLIWGGATYMMAGGSDEKVKKAKNTVFYAVIGLVLSFASYAILNFILNGVILGSLK